MSHQFLDSDFLPCDERSAVYLRIEAYDIASYTEIILKYGKNCFLEDKSEFYPVYIPPRYLCTLRVNTLKNISKDTQENTEVEEDVTEPKSKRTKKS